MKKLSALVYPSNPFRRSVCYALLRLLEKIVIDASVIGYTKVIGFLSLLARFKCSGMVLMVILEVMNNKNVEHCPHCYEVGRPGPLLESDSPWFNGPRFLYELESEWSESETQCLISWKRWKYLLYSMEQRVTLIVHWSTLMLNHGGRDWFASQPTVFVSVCPKGIGLEKATTTVLKISFWGRIRLLYTRY